MNYNRFPDDCPGVGGANCRGRKDLTCSRLFYHGKRLHITFHKSLAQPEALLVP